MTDYNQPPRQQPDYQQPEYQQAPQPAYQQPAYQQQPGPTPYGAGTAPGYAPAGYPYPANLRWNTLSIVGFILAFVVSPAGLIVSIIALIQINRTQERGKGLAIAGIVIGIINTLLIAVSIAFMFWAISEVLTNPGYFYNYSNDGGLSSDDLDAMMQYTSYVTAFLGARI